VTVADACSMRAITICAMRAVNMCSMRAGNISSMRAGGRVGASRSCALRSTNRL